MKGPGSAQPAQAGRQRGGQAREQGGRQARGDTAAGLLTGKRYGVKYYLIVLKGGGGIFS